MSQESQQTDTEQAQARKDHYKEKYGFDNKGVVKNE
jgi:hypothetical protein